MVNNKNFNPDLLKIEKKSYKNIDIYYIGYITIKNHLNIYSVNPLYFIINEAKEYIEESNGNKYLALVYNDNNKETLKKYAEIWNGIKSLIEKTNDKHGDYDEKYLKIEFDSDDYLPLDKILNLYNMTIIVRSVFQQHNKYHPQILI